MKTEFSIGLLCLILACSCDKQNRTPSIRTLPMDSSLAIIMEATGLLTDPCVPMYWPRDFSTKKVATHYIAYVRQNRPGQRIGGIHPHIRLGSDSSFYPLIDYAVKVDLQEISPKDVNSLSNQRVKVKLTDGLNRNFTDDELGYITISPVTTNQQLNQAVFFYELFGDGHSSWIVCAHRRQNRWIIVLEKRLSIS